MTGSARHCMLILGMHVSGASLLSRLVSFLGAALPATLRRPNFVNEKGYWDSLRLSEFHQAMLRKLDSAWHDWRPCGLSSRPPGCQEMVLRQTCAILASEYGDAPFFGVKSSLVCRFFPSFATALQTLGVEVSVLMPLRNPLEVCESLELSSGMARADAAMLWLRYNLDAESATRDARRAMILHSDLLADWRRSVMRLTDALQLVWPVAVEDAGASFDAYLDTEQPHQPRTAAEVASDPVLQGWVATAWGALVELCRDTSSREARIQLDRIRAAFDLAAPFMYSLKHGADAVPLRTTSAGAPRGSAQDIAEARSPIRSRRERRSIRLEDHSPVAIGGIGGSGTRVVADILIRLGIFMGSDLNPAFDNVWYTLLFNRADVLTSSLEELRRYLEIFANAMVDRRGISPSECSLIQALLDAPRPAWLKRWWLQQRAKLLIKATSAWPVTHPDGWGWKEPNTHLLLEPLSVLLPGLRYIHVVRNGLDIACSRNQRQQRFWGPLLESAGQGTDGLRQSLKFWCQTHRRVLETGARMGERFHLLSFDALCEDPVASIQKLCRFLGREGSPALLAELARNVRTPLTMGRFRDRGLEAFDAQDVAYVASLGFRTS